MKRALKASTHEELADRVDELYGAVVNLHESSDIADSILEKYGASEDDNGPEGYLTGVSDEQMQGMISEFTEILHEANGYKFNELLTLENDEMDVVYQALRQFSAGNEYDRRIQHNLLSKLENLKVI